LSAAGVPWRHGAGTAAARPGGRPETGDVRGSTRAGAGAARHRASAARAASGAEWRPVCAGGGAGSSAAGGLGGLRPAQGAAAALAALAGTE
ncbi:unnamed protein product, partial [Effrenium voratum]